MVDVQENIVNNEILVNNIVNKFNYKFVDINFLKNLDIYFYEPSKRVKMIKTQSRSSTIFPCCKNMYIYIYNGKKYIPLYINKDILGHKFGEFIYTRRFVGHKKEGHKLVFKKKNVIKKNHIKNVSRIIKINDFYMKKKMLNIVKLPIKFNKKI